MLFAMTQPFKWHPQQAQSTVAKTTMVRRLAGRRWRRGFVVVKLLERAKC